MWFQKVVDMIPYLEVKRYSDEINISTGVGELHLLSTDLNKMGGVYVNLDTIMLLNVWNSNQIGIADAATVPVIGFVAVNKFFNLTNLVQKIIEVGDIRKINITASTSCVLSRAFKGHEQCCLIQDNLHPINIMRDKSPFASFTRFLYYGTSKILEPRRSFQPIPKIVHYTWFGGGSMTYDMYLSFQSTLRFVKPTQIIIYVDSYDLGSYFEAMNNYSLVTVVYYGQPLTVFQKPFKGLIHISDYVRTDALLRLGGIYLDWDAFWLKPVDDLLTLGYETIAAFDHFFGMGTRKDFPDIINSGVVLARPGSRFIALWQESFRKYTGEDPTFHTIEMVYKLYEEHPNLLYIERRLQVMCFNLRCHPLWLPNFRNEKIHNEFDFTKDAYAVHFTHPLPKSFKSKDEMSKGKDFFANMARHVYGP